MDGDQRSRVAKRILVVEDNRLNLRLFTDVLSAHGFEVEGVDDARRVMERATARRPHGIVMDIQLPHISGLELMAMLRRDPLTRTVPVLAVTAFVGREDEARIRAAGAQGYVSKPIALKPFVAAVTALVA